MKVELWPLDRVKPYENNPRINDGSVDAVAASIAAFGFRKPIVVDGAGVIVAGHTCYRAAVKLALPKVPVHVAADLKPEQVRAYRIADNKVGELSEWDWDKLAVELGELQAHDVDLLTLGFSPDDVADILGVEEGKTDPDDVPTPPDKATTVRGDLWILGEHRLLCGDSSAAADVDRVVNGGLVQMVNTDPPYNVNVQVRTDRTGKQLRAKDRPIENDCVTEAEFERLLAAWFGNLARVLEPGRAFYIWGGFANVSNYPAPLRAAGLRFAQAIIWVKNQAVLTRKDFMTGHEWCFYGWREGAAHAYFGPQNVSDVWELTRARDGTCDVGKGLRLAATDGARIDVLAPAPDRRLRVVEIGEGLKVSVTSAATDVWRVTKVPGLQKVHITEKPVELAVRAMQYSSQAGDAVLDLFGGSGSTAIAAEQTGRRARLVELDPLYCDVIVRRWEEFTGKKAQREGDHGETKTARGRGDRGARAERSKPPVARGRRAAADEGRRAAGDGGTNRKGPRGRGAAKR